MASDQIILLREIRELLKLNAPAAGSSDARPRLFTIGLNSIGTVPFSLPSRCFGMRFLPTGGDMYGMYFSAYSASAFKFTSGNVFQLTFDCGVDASNFHVFVFNGVTATLSAWVVGLPETSVI